jgi:pimeloyl-ACP methyl ester carboxylesterase
MLHPLVQRLSWPLLRKLYTAGLLPAGLRRRLQAHQDVLKRTATPPIRSFRRIIRDATADTDLRTVQVPTLVLAGLEDRKIYLHNLQTEVTLSPSVRLETVAAGHHIPHTQTKLLAERLRTEAVL